MSGHYISVICTSYECDAFEEIYTGDIYLEYFSDEALESETITIPCKQHERTKK